jgi:hypothetical protein
MASTIGIKVANGEFYPIMEENSPVKKRLVVTTAHDNQKSIQIDLYNSYEKTMADALYVGSLVVENLAPRPKGQPDIEMILSSNSAGQIVADAVDLDASVGGVPQHLSVSLADVEEDDRENDEIPDFDLEGSEHPSSLYDKSSSIGRHAQKKKFPWFLLIIAAALLLVIGGILCLLFFTNRSIAIRERFFHSATTAAPVAAEPLAAPRTQTPVEVQEPRAATPVISAAQQSPAVAAAGEAPDRTRPLPVVTIPQGGMLYKIRWGDTLWDISEAFYRNPWLYQRIARFNNIRNPDFIISGTTIRIPPVN